MLNFILKLRLSRKRALGTLTTTLPPPNTLIERRGVRHALRHIACVHAGGSGRSVRTGCASCAGRAGHASGMGRDSGNGRVSGASGAIAGGQIKKRRD